MGIYSFDGGSLWTNEGSEDENAGYYLQRKNTSRDEPIELDINDPDYQEKIVPAVDELKRRMNAKWGKSPDSA